MRRFLQIVLAGTFIGSLAVSAQAAETLKVVANQGNPPFEFEDASGEHIGFEVDIVKEIAQRMGAELHYTAMPFNALFAAVQSGRADVAIGATTITEKRLENVSFTQPIIDSNQCVVVSTKHGVNGFEDMKGKKVGVVTGTVGEAWASRELQEKYGFSDIMKYDGSIEPVLDLQSGRTSAAINDCPINAYIIADKPGYKIIFENKTGDQGGLMMAKNGPKLEQVNGIISDMKKDGTLVAIFEKWFKVSPGSDSATANVLPIPQGK